MREEMILAVKRGAVWLDDAYPEWPQAIRLEHLDLNDPMACVIGQIGGDFYAVLDWLAEAVGDDEAEDFMSDHGFNVASTAWMQWFKALTAAWQEYITSARLSRVDR